MFMGRVLLFIVPVFAVFVASLSGADLSGLWKPVDGFIVPVPEVLLPFFVFMIVTEFTSWIAHVRRFNEAHKSPLRATIVLVPLMLGLAAFFVGAQGGIKQYEAMHAPKPAVTAEAPAEDGAEAAAAKPQPQQRRRPGPPQSERDMAASSGLGLAMLAWAPTSFFVMLWTLLFVARIPNGGVGRFRTGSDIAQGEEELPPAYAAG